MVTSNKLPDKRIVKMTDSNNGVVVPQRTLLGEVNQHITCPLCRGYYIDATTIVECLHSFCRSCIIKHLQVKSYCPVCEMMINSAKPNIKLDKALQDIVYKLVPGLFQKEMDRRQQFYASRPGPAATATPEQRGEDTERVIFSPEDVISFSLEYADVNDTDSVSSKSSDSNEAQLQSATSRRYLQCPAVVNISHLKKFLSMKFDIDSTQYAIDVLYKRVPLPDCYTLMDIAYIYNWKRNEPMRFFYQISDDVSTRNRLFDSNKKTTHFHERKPSPGSKERDINSPESNANYQVSEASSGNNSPMPEDHVRQLKHENLKINEKFDQAKDKKLNHSFINKVIPKKKDEDVEKSQFLNSFELTAKSSPGDNKSPDKKVCTNEKESKQNVSTLNTPKTTVEDTLKRKNSSSSSAFIEMKKLKVELEKTKLTGIGNISSNMLSQQSIQGGKTSDSSSKSKNNEDSANNSQIYTATNVAPAALSKEARVKTNIEESDSKKSSCYVGSPQKRKPMETSSMLPPASPTIQSISQKTVSPLKLQIPKPENKTSLKINEPPKSLTKKMPDLKPSPPTCHMPFNKPPINKIRMDLLANNSDPTMDRSKILSQVKSSLMASPNPTGSGDPLKSLFDSCKINIPSSLSITLTDQKTDARSVDNPPGTDQKNNSSSIANKTISPASNNTGHKVPSTSVHNYIEILKLPESDPKKQTKPEGPCETKPNSSDNSDNSVSKPVNKSETSTKGPVPNLKPIADTKLGKQNANALGPITFQQTFEKQLQTLQTDKKPKVPKNKAQVPKLVPASPKTFNKINIPINKPNNSGPLTTDPKQSSAALDLSTPHNFQSQLTPHQSKAFETMQSIVNLAKKQNLNQSKPMPASQSNLFASLSNRTLPTSVSPSRLPSNNNTNINNPVKHDRASPNVSQVNQKKPDLPNKINQVKPTPTPTPVPTPGYQMQQTNMSPTQPSSRQTRSPSSSPKLVIAEEKQGSNSSLEHCNQSNQITSTQLSNQTAQKAETPKSSSPNPGTSKPVVKQMKPVPTANKITGIRQPITPTVKSSPTLNSPTDFLTQPQLISAQHAINLRHQMELQWLKARQFLSNIHDLNKDKQ